MPNKSAHQTFGLTFTTTILLLLQYDITFITTGLFLAFLFSAGPFSPDMDLHLAHRNILTHSNSIPVVLYLLATSIPLLRFVFLCMVLAWTSHIILDCTTKKKQRKQFLLSIILFFITIIIEL